MGHLQSLALPKSKAWREVLALIDAGADAEAVAGQAALASERALSGAMKDPAFLAAARVLVELPLAARSPGFSDWLSAHDMQDSDLASAPAFLSALGRMLDATPASSDLGEMARMALLRSVAEEFEARLPSLFPPEPSDLRSALGRLAGGDGFATFARRFFAGLTGQTLSYYLSRVLAEHTGADRRFAGDADRVAFDAAIERHAWESAAIVSEFASGWYGKNIWQGDGPTEQSIAGFASYAFTKLRRELGRRRDAA